MRLCQFFIFLLLSFINASCGKYYLSVDQQWVDVNSLASMHIGTPDPRQAQPPTGQMLIIDRRVPKSVLDQKPYVLLDIIYWDYTTKTIQIPMKRRMAYKTYKLFGGEYQNKGGILTYMAKIVTEDGKVFKESKHQLWVELIKVED